MRSVCENFPQVSSIDSDTRVEKGMKTAGLINEGVQGGEREVCGVREQLSTEQERTKWNI